MFTAGINQAFSSDILRKTAEQRNWDMSTQSQTVRAAVPFCGGLTQNKIWPNEEQVWGGTQRPPVFPTAPPPPAYAASKYKK